MRRLLRPEFLHGAYFSNRCAKYSTGSAVTAAMSEIGEAALLRPKFLHGAYFSDTCVKYSAGSDVTAAMSEIGEVAAASEVSARSVFPNMCAKYRSHC